MLLIINQLVMKNQTELVKFLKSFNGTRFAAIKGYTNSNGEVSDSVINLGASYTNARAKDIEYLRNLDVKTIESEFEVELLEEARLALLASLIRPNEKRSNGQKDAYIVINNAIKLHRETLDIFIYAFCESKKVIIEGEYKTVNSRPLTLAKNLIKKGFRTAKFRQYRLEEVSMLKSGDNVIM